MTLVKRNLSFIITTIIQYDEGILRKIQNAIEIKRKRDVIKVKLPEKDLLYYEAIRRFLKALLEKLQNSNLSYR